MAEEIKDDRRSFLRTAAMSIATLSLGTMGSVRQQATAAGVQLPIEGE
jgi:hypothetical protein